MSANMGNACGCEPAPGAKDVKATGEMKTVTKVLEDGSTYKGETKDGIVRHGKGTYTYPDGKTSYEGDWIDGKAHGVGTFKDGESEYS